MRKWHTLLTSRCLLPTAHCLLLAAIPSPPAFLPHDELSHQTMNKNKPFLQFLCQVLGYQDKKSTNIEILPRCATQYD